MILSLSNLSASILTPTHRKNRRDGATVSFRVLHMADTVGRELFKNAASAASDPAQLSVSSRSQRRSQIEAHANL